MAQGRLGGSVFCGNESRDQRLAKGDGVMRKTAAAIFIGLICIITQGCSGARHEPPPYQSKMVHDKGGSTLYTMQPSSLIEALSQGFRNNEVAARQKYMEKRVAVEGPIGSIYSLSNGDPALSLDWTDYISTFTLFFGSVDCQFSKVFINDIAEMRRGQNVIVIGTVYDYTFTRRSTYIVSLKDCIFAQPVQPANPAKSQ